MSDVRERIEKLIADNPVLLFMKGTPQFPQCGFSGRVVQILDYIGAPVVGVNVLEDAEIRQGIKEYANWPTIPQLYVKGEFVGGADIVTEMFQSGELAAMLTDVGISVEQRARADPGPGILENLRPCDRTVALGARRSHRAPIQIFAYGTALLPCRARPRDILSENSGLLLIYCERSRNSERRRSVRPTGRLK